MVINELLFRQNILTSIFWIINIDLTMFVMFQAVFIWAQPFIAFIEDSITWLGGA
jgi:ferrous iron transport protein B